MKHLYDLIEEKKNSTKDEQKIQLIICVVFKHITDITKQNRFFTRSNNILLTHTSNTNNVLNKLIDSFFEKYEHEENILRNGSNYTFDYVDITTMKFHTIGLVKGSSYIPAPKWIADKKATINPKNLNDNMCFSYSIIAALHYDDVKKNPHRISHLKPNLKNYNWKDIQFPPTNKDYSTFEKNNLDIALNILSASSTETKINIIKKSDHNNTRNKQVHLLMITDNNNNWHYTTIKSISRLFRGVTSTNNGDFYCLNCLHSFRTKNKLLNHEKLCKNHKHCEMVMPTEENKILKFTSGDKQIHHPHIMYADLETLTKEISLCTPNTDNSYTEKKKHSHTMWLCFKLSKNI